MQNSFIINKNNFGIIIFIDISREQWRSYVWAWGAPAPSPGSPSPRVLIFLFCIVYDFEY